MSRTDNELVRAFREGDKDSLGELIARYRRPLYAYLLKLLRDNDAADDIFQEVFAKMIGNPGAFSHPASPAATGGKSGGFSAWLFTVAHHAAMDHFRAGIRRREESLDAETDDHPALSETLAAREPSPEAALDAADQASVIESAFEKLSSEQREVFIMRHYSGLSFREIAEALQVPIGTVLARMSRGLAKMRAELEQMQ